MPIHLYSLFSENIWQIQDSSKCFGTRTSPEQVVNGVNRFWTWFYCVVRALNQHLSYLREITSHDWVTEVGWLMKRKKPRRRNRGHEPFALVKYYLLDRKWSVQRSHAIDQKTVETWTFDTIFIEHNYTSKCFTS